MAIGTRRHYILDEGYCFALRHLPKGRGDNSHSGLFWPLPILCDLLHLRVRHCSFEFHGKRCEDNLLNYARALGDSTVVPPLTSEESPGILIGELLKPLL